MSEVIHSENYSRSVALCRLLTHHFPRARGPYDRLDVPSLSATLGLSRATAYRSLKEGKLSPKTARAIIKASRKRISDRDLYPFVLY